MVNFRSFRFWRWWVVALMVVVALVVWMVHPDGPEEPEFQGRKLGAWLRGHPRDYIPALRAVGTSAVPYLLAETRAVDSKFSKLFQKLLQKVSIEPFWRTARERYYHAGIALQILDTNAAPAVLDMVFSAPIERVQGNPSYSAACALGWFGSPEASRIVEKRLVAELENPDPEMRRNAAMAFNLSFRPSSSALVRLRAMAKDRDARVREAAADAVKFNEPAKVAQ